MLAAAGGAYWLTTSATFAFAGPAEGSLDLRYTDPATVLSAAGLDGHPNVVRLRSDAMRAAILRIPSIADADVRIILPDRVAVSATERQPAFALHRPDATYLVDADGLVLATVGTSQPAALGIPTIDDDRETLAPDVHVGGSLDPIDLGAMLQLGAVTPALIDSRASSLALAVHDDNGFVLSAQPNGWQAIFGNYTPTLRPVDEIPRQVQCLRSLIGASESDVRTVYLAPLDERCGTFLPLQVPRASPSPAPAR